MSQIETLLDEGDDDDWKSILTLFRMGGRREDKKAPYQFFSCNFYRRRN